MSLNRNTSSNPSSPGNSNPGFPRNGSTATSNNNSNKTVQQERQQQLQQLLASLTHKPISWLGAMSFDVSSARLQYSRVLIGENETPINCGDMVLFVAATPGSSQVSILVGRVQSLFHNPRGKCERTAAITVATQLSSDPDQLLSRVVLPFDEIPAGTVLRSTAMEAPLVNVLARVEVRETSTEQIGTCLSCFLRHTPGISVASCIDWTRAPPGASQMTMTQQQHQQQNSGGSGDGNSQNNNAAAVVAGGPPVFVTDSPLRDSIIEFNGRVAAGAGASERVLAKARRQIEERLTSLVVRVHGGSNNSTNINQQPQNQNSQCAACRQHRNAVLARSNVQQQQQQQAAATVEPTSEIVSSLLQRLLIATPNMDLTTVAPDSPLSQSFSKVQPTTAAAATTANNKPQDAQQKQNQRHPGKGGGAGQQQQRRDREEEDDNDGEEQQHQQSLLPQAPKRVFSAPSLIAAGIDPSFLRAADPAAFRM